MAEIEHICSMSNSTLSRPTFSLVYDWETRTWTTVCANCNQVL